MARFQQEPPHPPDREAETIRLSYPVGGEFAKVIPANHHEGRESSLSLIRLGFFPLLELSSKVSARTQRAFYAQPAIRHRQRLPGGAKEQGEEPGRAYQKRRGGRHPQLQILEPTPTVGVEGRIRVRVRQRLFAVWEGLLPYSARRQLSKGMAPVGRALSACAAVSKERGQAPFTPGSTARSRQGQGGRPYAPRTDEDEKSLRRPLAGWQGKRHGSGRAPDLARFPARQGEEM